MSIKVTNYFDSNLHEALMHQREAHHAPRSGLTPIHVVMASCEGIVNINRNVRSLMVCNRVNPFLNPSNLHPTKNSNSFNYIYIYPETCWGSWSNIPSRKFVHFCTNSAVKMGVNFQIKYISFLHAFDHELARIWLCWLLSQMLGLSKWT